MLKPSWPWKPADPKPEEDDESLLTRARQDLTEFAAIYRRYSPAVYRYLYSRVGNTAEAEDLTSQVFLAALQGLSDYQGRSPFAVWLFSIARYKVIDFYRNRCPIDPLESAINADSSPDLLTHLIQEDERQGLTNLISHLKESEKEMLRLRFAARLSYVEIAKILGKKESAVKMSFYRLLKRLEQQMEAYYG